MKESEFINYFDFDTLVYYLFIYFILFFGESLLLQIVLSWGEVIGTFCSLQKHICSKDHPYHKFSAGNWDTLEVVPKAKGLDTRLELIKFYKENYSANIMHLVVYGKESLEKLQNLVESKFKDVLNIERSKICFPGQPCSSEHLQILVKVVPIKRYHTLNIIWPVISNIRYYKESPSRYLSHLIGNKGVGSLFYALKSLVYLVKEVMKSSR
ncbi:putative insulysin [Dioscorea sansibarensis]